MKLKVSMELLILQLELMMRQNKKWINSSKKLMLGLKPTKRNKKRRLKRLSPVQKTNL